MKFIIPLKLFLFSKEKKYLQISSEVFSGSFPREFYIRSHHTDKVVKFVLDEEKAKLHEFWDGEMAEYIPSVPMKNVKCVVVVR